MKILKLIFALSCFYSLTLLVSCKKDSEAPKPVITGFNPFGGAEATTVTISGNNFSTTPANNIVKFNGKLASVSASTASSITTTVPAGSVTGPISVSVDGKIATSSEDFTILETLSYSNNGAWNCASGISCQGLYKIQCVKGSSISISVDNISSGSFARIALYAPGVVTGGVNLLTNNSSTKDLLCSVTGNCSSASAESFSDFNIPTSGIYTVAVTRDWGVSCEGTGTYKLTITSPIGLTFVGETNDTASGATGHQCP